MIQIEKSSGNVYADIGTGDPDEMLTKARLVTKIAEIIDERRWTQRKTAEVLGIAQPKLSNLLAGRFRGVSETKLLEYLTRLGQHVQIVVSPAGDAPTSPIELVFAP
jgi:predicted XRE-type DNA-binding protein